MHSSIKQQVEILVKGKDDQLLLALLILQFIPKKPMLEEFKSIGEQ